MSYDFIITLKRPGYRFINFISVILLFLFLIAFGYYILQAGWQNQQYLLLLIPAMIIGLMVMGFVKRKNPEFLQYFRTELFIAALGWFLIPAFADVRYIGWLYALMGFIERFAKMPDQWAFSKEKVVRKSIPKTSFEWVEIDNVMIRDNIFTLDLRNNKILQKELDNPVDPVLQNEFNEYCGQQLHFNSVEPGPRS